MANEETGRGNAKQIVILGGGFGGLYAALDLEKRLARELARGDVHITLVNRDNFFLFTPMLHEVAASDLDPANIVNPVHKLLKRADFFCGEVEAVDLPSRQVRVRHGAPGAEPHEQHEHVLTYDHLVLAPGSVAGFAKAPGAEKHALTMRTLSDAVALRGRLIESLETADADCFAAMRTSLLSVVVAGGGFAGVETAGAVNDFLRDAVKHYRNLSADQLRVVLVHAGEALLPELGPKLGNYACRKLQEAGIEVRLQTGVVGATADRVALSDGASVDTRTLVWTVGNAAHPLLATLPCANERGRIHVNAFLEVPEWPGVWVLGDGAHIPDARTGRPHPPTAQHALREGQLVARNIAAALRGGQQTPFRFRSPGQLASIGRRAGVANLLGVSFSGFWAWWLWRTVYLLKLPRFEKKLRVALDWTLDLFFSKDLVQLSTPAVGAAHRVTNDTNLPAGAVGPPVALRSEPR